MYLYCFSRNRPPPRSTLFPYTTLFRSRPRPVALAGIPARWRGGDGFTIGDEPRTLATAHDRRVQARRSRSEEHTSELQSRQYLVCRLLLEKKKESLLNRRFGPRVAPER